MRAICFLVLLVVLGGTGLFALQNQEAITLRYLDRSVSCPTSLLVAVVYVLGMVSGWTVVGVVRRTLWRASERPS